MTSIVDRSVLYQPENMERLKKLEESFNRPLREITLREVVGVDKGLVTQKVLDTVIRGADENAVWRQLPRTVDMPSPMMEVPLVTRDDFKVHKGLPGTRPRVTGGAFDRIELDCSDTTKTLYRVALDVSKTWIQDAAWDAVEEALAAAGSQLYLQIAKDIMTKYEGDVDTSMTDTVANWGNNHYKALVRGASLIRKNGMEPTVVIINPDEEYDLMILDYFVHQDYARAARGEPVGQVGGEIGRLYGSIPIFSTTACTPAKMTVAARDKAVAVGVRQDLQIQDYDDPIEGLVGAVLTMRLDIKSGKDAKGTKPTKLAWAVATSA